MQTTSTTSTQYSVNMKDILKGLLIAVITPVITIIYTSLQAGTITFNWKIIGMTALAAALAYIIKNFLTPAKIIVDATPRTIADIKSGDAQVKVVPGTGNKPVDTSAKP